MTTTIGMPVSNATRSPAKGSVSEGVALSTWTDEQLLLQYRQEGGEYGGARAVFDELVHRYERELFSYLRRYLGDAMMAEDAFQGTFLQVHLKCGQFQEGRSFRPWVYTIATHQAIDAQRRNKRHRMVSLDRKNGQPDDEQTGSLTDMLVSSDQTPVELVEANERRQRVRAKVAELPEALRSVVALVYYQGLKYREAADILDVPVGTVKSRLHTAIGKLNEAWES